MLNKLRAYLSGMIGTLVAVMVAATAFAVAGNVNANRPENVPPVETPNLGAASQNEDGSSTSAAARSTTGTAKSEANAASEGPNHGHCVSYWAHQAKAQGLKGRARGDFISQVAATSGAVTKKVPAGGTPDSTCQFQAQLDAAKAPQAGLLGETSDAGGPPEGKGKPDDPGSRGKAKGKTKTPE